MKIVGKLENEYLGIDDLEIFENIHGCKFVIYAVKPPLNKVTNQWVELSDYEKGHPYTYVDNPEDFLGESSYKFIYIQKGYDGREVVYCINFVNNNR